MTSVEVAEYTVQAEQRYYGTEKVALELAHGRVLAEDIVTDRDMPPYDRVTMDGIAISYAEFESGTLAFAIKATQGAGDRPVDIEEPGECIEIMTGAALPPTVDTVIRYEDLDIKNGVATITIDTIKKGQNIHYTGIDKKANDTLAKAGQVIDSTTINVAASVGMDELVVKRLPKVVIISNGDELVPVDETPNPYQVRRSNSYAIAAVLQQHCIDADMLHIPDDEKIILEQLSNCLTEYDVLILSGGVSMGKYDYLPKALEGLMVQKLFHKVAQRPGKPFWFGANPDHKLVFAFPGNPVSAFMCTHRYFIPWLNHSLGLPAKPKAFAILSEDFSFKPSLQYFLQVKLEVTEDGRLLATPCEGHGSGDYVNLLQTDAFMELPSERTNFEKGESFRIWPYKHII